MNDEMYKEICDAVIFQVKKVRHNLLENCRISDTKWCSECIFSCGDVCMASQILINADTKRSHYPVLKDKPSGVNPQAGHDGTMEG